MKQGGLKAITLQRSKREKYNIAIAITLQFYIVPYLFCILNAPILFSPSIGLLLNLGRVPQNVDFSI